MKKLYKLCPKISDDLAAFDMIKDFVKENIEIQLISKPEDGRLAKIFKEIKAKNFIIHAPGSAYEIENIVRSESQQKILEGFLQQCVDSGKNTKFVLHCGWTNYLASNKEIVDYLVDLIGRFNVPILLENTIHLGEYDRAVKVVNLAHITNLDVCLGMSHVRAILNQGATLEYFKGLYRCKHIHMSYSSNNDGYERSITHGVTHPTIESALEDAKILADLGIFGITMCPEVAEVGDMYHTREQQVKEIKLLTDAGLVRTK